ncbi:N-acetylglucosamine-6-phosphate deacetylase [Neptunicella marina]|uniref:N-acetylgalactosamine-6-phosphate deacetylase n=1 Tax=Neptunicella marina TaxID=2125989 RepID=A0A8J6IQ70_9ALTE|nr:N-acetylglucosamine-6-phosphate deacetylase [Neptunicella marina]MBC3765715.1 N-acetylglucosamine-6-phosphate deacetylase [Neptunicella marina]
MSQTFIAKQLFDGSQFHDNIAFSVAHGKIDQLGSSVDSSQATKLDGLVTAGYVDAQVNGGGGVLFNQSPTTEALQKMVQGHATYGTTAMMPTLITDELPVIEAAADAMAQAIAQKMAGIAGVHFEGPHLSTPKRGIHSSDFIRPVSDKELAQYCRQDLGKVIVTVAPENVPADIIKELVANGVKVCLGHSNATSDIVLSALEAGASGFTHLYNAMSPLTSREPGMVGVALNDDNSYCGLIVDHHHLHPISSQLAIKAKGWQHIMLVTDAMAHVGSDIQSLPYLDTEIIRDGDKLTLPNGTLAGSALDMATAVRNCHKDLNLPLEQCLNMASIIPATYLGLQDSQGKLAQGFKADFILLDDNLQVMSTWIGGQSVFKHN